MTRKLAGLLLIAALHSVPATAGAPYYGPMKAWQGIGYKFGVKHEVEADGSWRVEAATRSGEAIDMALYHAAELARERGFAYVELLGGRGSRSPGYNNAKLYARPSHSPAPPATCPEKRRNPCYTADVAELLRILGGPGGTQPGVAIADHTDRYGRSVVISGYGIAAASLTPRPAVPVAAPPRPVAAVPVGTSGTVAPLPASLAAAARFEAARKSLSPSN